MCPNWDWLSTYEIVSKDVVFMGNNASSKIIDIGTFIIKMFDEVIKTLADVRHVPDLKKNLISLSTLDSKRYKYTDEGRVLKVSKDVLVVMKGHKKICYIICLIGIHNYKSCCYSFLIKW